MKRMLVPGALGLALAFLVPTSASAATTLAWNMGETSGHTMRDTSGTYNGSISGDVTLGVAGVTGKAYEFNGGLVSIPSAPVLNPGRGRFSVSISFKSSDMPSGDSYDLVRKGYETTRGGDWKIEVLPGGNVHCQYRGNKRDVNVRGASNVVNGLWNRITCTKSRSGVTLMVNGATQAWSKRDPGKVSNSSAVHVGAKKSSQDQVRGRLDSLTIAKG